MKHKMIKITSAALLAGTVFTSLTAFADIKTDTIDEVWGKPTLVYGAGLNNAEVNQTNNAFNIADISNVNRQVNSGQDFQTYLGQSGVSDNSLFSSVLVQKQSKGKGVNVDIKTPNNITSVTETQYANAAITAGATDVQIDVASVKKVTGESALVGVYKALSANGVNVDTDRTQAATQELQTVNEIADAQKNNDDFNSKALDLATAQIKQGLADYKKENGTTASDDAVQNIITKALKDNGLSNILTNDQIQSLVDFAKTYQSTSAIDSQEVANQLKQYKDDVYSKFKNVINSDNAHNVWEKISSFFENMWKNITNFFGNLGNN